MEQNYYLDEGAKSFKSHIFTLI